MKAFSHKETVASVEALGEVLKKTKGKLKAGERRALVGAVLKTVTAGQENATATKAKSRASRPRK
jgi:hypothetical protein